MSTYIDADLLGTIDTAINTAKAELERLEGARCALTEAPVKAPRQRVARGERTTQMRRAVRGRPNRTAGAYAREIGISPNQARALLRRLTDAGELRRNRRDGRRAATYSVGTRWLG